MRKAAFIIALLIYIPIISKAQSSERLWEYKFRNTIKSGDTTAIKSLFSDGFGHKEINSWKYELEREYLSFNESWVIPLDSGAVIMYIPTNNTPYTGDNHNEYFDFIYRIYKVNKHIGSYIFSERIMDDYIPDLVNYKLNIDVDTDSRIFIFNCNILLNTEKPHILLKLAKDFEISEFRINGINASYDRFGYIIHSRVDSAGTHNLSIKGSLKSSSANNQFISMNDKSFFIRLGGFAAIPSPPPGNNGRNFFSYDSTHFDITYNYPKEYILLQYGDSTQTIMSNGQKQTETSINGRWMDEITFYAQKDWDKKEIKYGDTQIEFYFNSNDEKERNFIMAEADTLVQWINKKFNNYGYFKINFVVLDNFVKGGLLNDGHSIIAQNAEIIGSGGIGYLHEICHSAPQPSVKDNYLWIKEGFTNYLSFEYLHSQKGEDYLWEDLKRRYLHCFDLYEESLINIRSTSIPTYWAAYSKASWVYRMLETEIGKDNFQETLYKLGSMGGIELRDNRSYMEIFEDISGKNLTGFEEQWLYYKKNPVLTVQEQLEKAGNNSIVKIKVLQKKPYFTLPLEVEIKTEAKIFRNIIRVEGKETLFEIPIKGNQATIKYDPDSRLFALIKDHKKSFVEGYDYIISKDTAFYASEDDSRKMQVWFTDTKNRISIFKKENNQVSILELTNELSPVTYSVNGDTVFTQDIRDKTIQFENNKYDIAEPIYPKEFITFLFSIVNWKEVNELSLLYLIPESMDCQVVHCNLKNKVEKGFEFTLKRPLSRGIIDITSVKGFPKSFTTLDDKWVKLEN